MSVIIGILLFLLALGLGGAASWFYFIKLRKPKVSDEAKIDVAKSEVSDVNRTELQKEIQERIKKNEEIRNKLKEKLGNIK